MQAADIFGSWLVLGPRERWHNGAMYWLCSCKCGRTHKFIHGTHLRNSRSTQCRKCQDDDAKARSTRPDTGFKKLLQRYKSGAQTRGIAWGLTEQNFRHLTSAPCHYTGRLPQSVSVSISGDTYRYSSIDRLDSSKGYTLDNCVPCASEVNLMKGTLSVREFHDLIDELHNFHQRKRVAIATW